MVSIDPLHVYTCDVITRARDDIRHVGVTGPVIALVLCFQNDTEKMVICVIVGCCKNSKRVQGISFYRLPAVISHQGDRAQELSQKRRGLTLGQRSIPTPAFVVGILCRVRVQYYVY